jgi:hypothetical protein
MLMKALKAIQFILESLVFVGTLVRAGLGFKTELREDQEEDRLAKEYEDWPQRGEYPKV